MTRALRVTRTESQLLFRSSASFVALLTLIAVVVVLASGWLCVQQLQNAKAHAERSLAQASAGLVEAVAAADQAAIERITGLIGRDTDVERVVVRDAQLRLLFDLDKGANTSRSRSLIVAMTPQSISTFRVDRALVDRGSVLGSVSGTYRIESLANSFMWLVAIGVAVLSIASILMWRMHVGLRRALTLPLLAIERVCDQITRTGDMSIRVPPSPPNEGLQLEETVNKLLHRLDQQEQVKAHYRAGLEREVETRTQALADTNDRLQKLAYISTETSLPNRAAFLDRLHKLCTLPHTSESVLGVFVIRIVRVRYANEAFGFDVGDLMIESAARVLSAMRSPESELFHLGGGEFAVIRSDFPDVMQDAANEMLRVDDVPFVYRGATLTMLPKIGYAVFPMDATNVDDLTRFAMLALNVATAPNSPAASVAYDVRLLEDSLNLEHIESAIKRAIDSGDFEPYFQSRVDTETGRVHGLEALIRWTSPELTGFTNYQLIPIAERSMLASELDSQMLRKVVEWLAALAVDGIRIPVAVNLSARSLQRKALPDEVRALVRLHGVDIAQIEFELTESVLKEKNDAVIRNIASLHEMGAHLLLADFGSGYASLHFLRELPISIVKIDKAFVQDLPEDATSMAIMESTIKLVHQLGKRVVAEGVETYGQWESLRSMGCDEAQGYFLMRPQGPGVVAEMLRLQFDTSVGHLTIDLAGVDKSDDFFALDNQH